MEGEEGRRERQIKKGKATVHYKAWMRINETERERLVRYEEGPVTPKIDIKKYKNRAWNGLYKIWRIRLHEIFKGDEKTKLNDAEKARMEIIKLIKRLEEDEMEESYGDELVIPDQIFCVICKNSESRFKCYKCDESICSKNCFNKHFSGV